MALSLCLMSVIGFANNRQVVGVLPANMPGYAKNWNMPSAKAKPSSQSILISSLSAILIPCRST